MKKLACLVCSFMVAARVFGADVTWTGGGLADDAWSTGANWSTGNVPANGDHAIFNTVGGSVTVTDNRTIQRITLSGAVNVTVTINSGCIFTIANSGGQGIQANGGDFTINGPGKLAMSSANKDTNHLDNGASLGRTLAINAEIIGAAGINDGMTGIEGWLANSAPGGTFVLGYPDNAFTLDFAANARHTFELTKISPSGQPSSFGTCSRMFVAGSILRYVGTGNATTDRAFLMNGNGGSLDYRGGLTHDGVGTLTWGGPIYNYNNNAHTLILDGSSAQEARITGPIYNSTGTIAVRKEGTGTWVLAGSNSFTAGLTVNLGTLGLDSTNAAGNVSQITMAGGTALRVNSLGTPNFFATFPALRTSGNVSITVTPASSGDAAVTFNGLSGAGNVAFTAPTAGTAANRIFITGLSAGMQGTWLTVNGLPAEYDLQDGLRVASTTTQGLATRGSTLPNGAGVQAVINVKGPSWAVPIALPLDPTTLYSLTQTVTDDTATVDTAGKTLLAGEVAIAAGAAPLIIGVAAQDGRLLPPLDLQASATAPDSTAITNLNPLIWYDPSEAENVTVSYDTVIGLKNKSTRVGASAYDAVVRSGWTAPLYAKGSASHSAQPMLKFDNTNQGLQSLADTGISGNVPRTIVAVMSRDTGKECIVSIGKAEGRQAFEPYLRNDFTRFGTYSADRDMAVSPAMTPIVMTFVHGFDVNSLNTFQGFANGVASDPRTEANGLITFNTPLHLMQRNGASSGDYRGQIGEVLLFDYALDNTQRLAVEAYLMAKWKSFGESVTTQSATLTLRNDSAGCLLSPLLVVNAAVTPPDSAAVSLIKAGAGDVILSGGATLLGPTLIDAGTLFVDTPDGVTDTFGGVISGAGKLAKDGPGTLYLPASAANLYTGGLDITGGAVTIGNSRSPGTGPIVITDGGALDISGGRATSDISVTNTITVSGAGPDGLGAIVCNGLVEQRNAFMNATITLDGNTTFGGTDRVWDIRDAKTVLDLNGKILTKAGTGQVRFSGGSSISNAAPGTAIHITAGTVGFEANGIFSPNEPLREVLMDNGARLGLYGVTTPFNWKLAPAPSSVLWAYGTDEYTNKNVVTSSFNLPSGGSLHLTADGSFAKNLTGKLSGSGGLVVRDGGLRALNLLSNPANDFAGNVAVSNAIVGLRSPATFPGGLPGLTSKLTLADLGGLRLYMDTWTINDVQTIVNSGLFHAAAPNSHRLQLEVPQGVSVNVPFAIGSTFLSDIDKLGQGSLSLDNNVTLAAGHVRSYAGALYLTNNVTLDTGANGSLIIGDGTIADGTGGLCTALISGNSVFTTVDRGRGVEGSGLYVALHNNTAVLDLTDNAQVTGRLIIGGWDTTDTTAVGAVYQSGNTTWLNTCGTGNDSRIGRYGYGYYRLDGGTHTMKGYGYLGSVNNSTSAGIFHQTAGAFVFNGKRETVAAAGAVGISYDGFLGVSRGGVGVLYLEGGTFQHYGELYLLDYNDNSSNSGTAIMTVTGTADAMVDRQIIMGDRIGANAILNLNGGKLTATYINRKYRATNLTTATVNFDGGVLCVTNNATERRLFVLDNASLAPLNAYIYEGGATVDLAEGVLRTMDIPFQHPAGSGIASIALGSSGTGYIAPPAVTITGGNGTGASAIAHIDRQSGIVTSIEVTSHGTGYTANPTVNLIGGGGTGAGIGTITRAANAPGGLTKAGPGTLILRAANTYKGPTRIEAGILQLAHPQALDPLSEIIIHDGTLDLGGHTVTNVSVTITGSGGIINGNIYTSSAVKTGPGTATWDVGIEFGLVALPPTPGLYEGVLSGAFNITDPNPGIGDPLAVELTTTAANGYVGENSAINGKPWPNNTTYAYSGYIWNRNATNETWSFHKSFDDSVYLSIDNVEVINHTTYNANYKTNAVDITPGPHAIEIRFGQGNGSVGSMDQGDWHPPTPRELSLAVDYLGRLGNTVATYMTVRDPGDGSRLTLTAYEYADLATAIRVEGGTLLFPSETQQEAGLWEGFLSGAFNLTDPNPSTEIEYTTTAANGIVASGGTINGKNWPNTSTYIYTGYIWNRNGTNETWSFHKSFDDSVLLKIDNVEYINHTTYSAVFKVNVVDVTPGPHPIEIRFGQGTGEVGCMNIGNWVANPRDLSLAVDYLGRFGDTPATYMHIKDPGDGSRLTRSIRVGHADLSGVTVDVSNGAILDLGGLPHPGLILSPAGDETVGVMGIANAPSGSLAGLTYKVTLDGKTDSDCITSAEPLDLGGLTIVPSNTASETPEGNKYLIATAVGGFTGLPTVEGFNDGRQWKVIRQGDNLWLTTQGGTVLLLR